MALKVSPIRQPPIEVADERQLDDFRKTVNELKEAGTVDGVTVGGSGETPVSGTGFVHITAGTKDAAAKLVDTADINPLQVTTAIIAADAVTFPKMQNVATDSLVGRDTAGTGDPENILLNATLAMDGAGNLQRAALTGDVTAPAGSNATTIANDAVTYAKMQNVSAASKLLGRGSSGGSGDPQEITLGTNISMTGTTVNVDASASTERVFKYLQFT